MTVKSVCISVSAPKAIILICFLLSAKYVAAQDPVRWTPLVPKKNVYDQFQNLDSNFFIGRAMKDGIFIFNEENGAVNSIKSQVGYTRLFYGFDVLTVGGIVYKIEQKKEGDQHVVKLEAVDKNTLERTDVIKTLLTDELLDDRLANHYTVSVNSRHLFLTRYSNETFYVAVFNAATLEPVYRQQAVCKANGVSYYPNQFTFSENGEVDMICLRMNGKNTVIVEAIMNSEGLTFGEETELEHFYPQSIALLKQGEREFIQLVASDQGHNGLPSGIISLEMNFPAIAEISTEPITQGLLAKDLDTEHKAELLAGHTSGSKMPKELVPENYTAATHLLADGSFITVHQGYTYLENDQYSALACNNFFIVKTDTDGKVEWVQFARSDFHVGTIEQQYGFNYSYLDQDGKLCILFNEPKQLYNDNGKYISEKAIEKQVYFGDNLSRFMACAMIRLNTVTGEYIRQLVPTPAADFIAMPGQVVQSGDHVLIYGSNAKKECFGEIQQSLSGK